MTPPDALPAIEPTPLERRQEALRLMRLGPSRVERLVAAAQCGKIDMAGLYHARRGHTLVGAAWGQVTPGHSAFCWPAGIRSGEPESTARHLHHAVNRHLDAAGVFLTQALLPARDVVNAMRLIQVGYQHLADLDYLASFILQFPSEKPTSELTFEPIRQAHHARLIALVERTYVDTLDCGNLDGVRSVEHVLTGYRRTGVYRPDWWIVATYQSQDAGCALVADHPEHDQCELMYVGIVPEFRGRGWGFELTRYVQWLVGRQPRDRMVLAVDDANWPARRMYDRLGFQAWDRRSVYVRTAHSDGSLDPSSGS